MLNILNVQMGLTKVLVVVVVVVVVAVMVFRLFGRLLVVMVVVGDCLAQLFRGLAAPPNVADRICHERGEAGGLPQPLWTDVTTSVAGLLWW